MIDRIKAAWFNGITYEIMSERLNVKKSTIGGWYHRNPELRISHPIAPARPVIEKAPVIRIYSQRAARIEAIKEAKAQQPNDNGRRGKYTLLTLPHNGCKWPFGSNPSEITFCGHEQQDGEPYCTEHSRLAYDIDTRTSRYKQRKAYV